MTSAGQLPLDHVSQCSIYDLDLLNCSLGYDLHRGSYEPQPGTRKISCRHVMFAGDHPPKPLCRGCSIPQKGHCLVLPKPSLLRTTANWSEYSNSWFLPKTSPASSRIFTVRHRRNASHRLAIPPPWELDGEPFKGIPYIHYCLIL